MLADLTDDLAVEEDDEHQWDAVRVDEDGTHEHSSLSVFCHVVEGTRRQETLWWDYKNILTLLLLLIS